MPERIALRSDGVGGGRESQTATATCYCGAVQLEVPIQKPGLVDTFICHCADCRKITASMFATNFIVLETHMKHNRGEDNLIRFEQSATIASGYAMENSFCSVCGTLMYRRGRRFPGWIIARTGTVDDQDLHDSVLKPRFELFAENKGEWLPPVEPLSGQKDPSKSSEGQSTQDIDWQKNVRDHEQVQQRAYSHRDRISGWRHDPISGDGEDEDVDQWSRTTGWLSYLEGSGSRDISRSIPKPADNEVVLSNQTDHSGHRTCEEDPRTSCRLN
ncbi:hypothetical protein KC367_g8674 [Hortaea werneckii]|nr:hypothetical protein KC367_g8674 [Hortaea werneckii]